MAATGLGRATHLKGNNKTGFKGVSWDASRKKYRAAMMIDGRMYHLGYFDDVLDAGIAASDFRLQQAAAIEASKQREIANRRRATSRQWAKRSIAERSAIGHKAWQTHYAQA